MATPAGWAKDPDRPLVVLVGPETSGGGEMVAAALQDYGRATVVGQRTLGKGNIQRADFPAHLGDLRLKHSTGYSLRPTGRNRHRFADSQPTDDWGVRPDMGFEAPLTADLSADCAARPSGTRCGRSAAARRCRSTTRPATPPGCSRCSTCGRSWGRSRRSFSRDAEALRSAARRMQGAPL